MRHAEISELDRPKGPEASRRQKAPILRHALPDELAKHLRDMIVEGELRPGGRIMMQRLCKRFGVSRTPLREALKILSVEGLVLLLPNRSAVVQRITHQTIDELIPILGALEIVAGQLACARIDAAGLAQVEALCKRLRHHFCEGDAKAYLEAEQGIRNIVVAAARNDTLASMYDMVLTKLRWPMIGGGAPPEWEQAVDEHERMVHALQLRDADLWALATQRHLCHWATLLRRGANHMPDGQAPGHGPSLRGQAT
jgi:DNA-binding GntR family transcriptional regulator